MTQPQPSAPLVAIVDDARFDAHRPLQYHPERPERLDAVRQGLASGLPLSRRLSVGPRAVTRDEVLRVHSAEHLERLDRVLGSGAGLLDADTYYGPGTREATFHAAGGVVSLVDALLDGRAREGIALLRPPGHHATPGGSMGFCLMNNVAIAAAAALARGVPRVAIVDWDVHHGNGTQDAFYDDPRVLFVSLHQWPLYPGTGHAEEIGGPEAKGKNLNVALPAGSGPAAYGEAFRRLVMPALRQHAAGLVLVSSGFDAHQRDPLAGMNVDDATFGAMATALLEMVRASGAPIAFVLEGGYDLKALENGMCEVARAIEGKHTHLPDDTAREGERRAVERTLELARPYWASLEP